MDDQNVVYMTKEGLQKIKEELEHLITVKRPELSERLQEAIAQGDLSENADYDYAKQEQAFLEGRIQELEDAIRRAKVIEDNGPTNAVRVGSTVTIAENGYDEVEKYRIVGAQEADPTNGYISNESPIGQALLGARVGEVVTVETPAGGLELEVKAID
ncbi:MAG TPA: transcription elongation factor GreA [Candidatus Sulfomarinibacteraceae bacterium]|nr:transcription elongation factor GreA [Candidatus Sulfomarinibacteraceae bacterium]